MTKKTISKVKKLPQLFLYLSSSQIISFAHQKIWSGIITTSQRQILARFNNSQVIRSLEAKAYLVLRTIYWLLEQPSSLATLFTDNSDIYHRFRKLLRQRKLEKDYQPELQFRLSQRGKIPWPTYLWLAVKLIANHNLNLTIQYLPPSQNPASLITKYLKNCAKCSRLKYITPSKRNCSICQKASRQKQFERWEAWQKEKKLVEVQALSPPPLNKTKPVLKKPKNKSQKSMN